MTEIAEKLLDECVLKGEIQLGRGNIISAKDVVNNPGVYPIYSSSAKGNGEFGKYGSYMFDEELITWSVDGGGRFFYRPKHRFSVTNVSGYMRIDPSKWNPSYVYYSLDLQHRNISFDYQTKAHPSIIRKLYTLNPLNLAEQNKIANILSTLDQAIEQTEAIIAKQQRIKTGLMQDLLTKGIDENGNIRSEATHEFKDSAIGRIPVDWEISMLENECVRVTDGTHQQVKTTDSGVPFLYVSCVREGVVLWDRTAMIDLRTYEIISKGREPKQGVILYTVVGSYGYAALVETKEKFSFQRHIAYILPNQEILNSNFLMEWMNSKRIREYADKAALGNAQKTITLGELRKFPLLVPSKDEQAKIVQCLSKQNKVIDQNRMVIDKLRNTKNGLMHDLLNGKVRVTDIQNPTLTPETL